MVTVAPVSVVTTDGLLNMTPFVAARSIDAPATDAFPLVSAKIVNVNDEVPSAFKTLALELILIVATFAFAFALVGVVVAPIDVPALPPPPPQDTSATAITIPIPYFIKFILIFLLFIFSNKD